MLHAACYWNKKSSLAKLEVIKEPGPSLHMGVWYTLLKHLQKINSDLHIASCPQDQWQYSPLLCQGTGLPSHAKVVWSWAVAVWPGSGAGSPGLWAVPAPGDSSLEPATKMLILFSWKINAPDKLDEPMIHFHPQLPLQNIILTGKCLESSNTLPYLKTKKLRFMLKGLN